MNFTNFWKLALPVMVCGCFATASAQVDKNKPVQDKTTLSKQQEKAAFTWRESADKWYAPKTYSYRFHDGTNATDPKDRGPVYTEACKDSANPGQCTENYMKAKFLNVSQPGLNYPSGYSGVEYVSFDVDENGKVSGYQVLKQPVACEICSQEAVNRISSLSVWQPAIQSGKPSKSSIVVPVYFNTRSGQNDQ
jgi:hypothetical protein